MKPVNKGLIALIVVSIVQLAFPLFFIAHKERVIEKGKEYVFKIQPVDPYDFFQGRYVNLSIRPAPYSMNNASEFKRNDIVYVEFTQDSTGVKVKNVSHKKTKHSLKLKLYAKPDKKIWLRLPFRRFFLEESKAQSIEHRLSRTSKHESFVHVKILNGDFVMTDISSDGKSLITGKPVQFPALGQ